MRKLLFLFLLHFLYLDSFGQKLRVGTSSVIINPSAGAFIAGDKQNRKFTGIHDSLYAKAVVIQQGNEAIGILTIDCIGLLYPDVLKIRQEVVRLCSFPSERLVVSSTHTHSGPDVVCIWGKDYSSSGVDPTYMQSLISKAALAVKQAYEQVQNAKAFVAETTFGSPWVQNICKEEIDRSVSILQFKDVEQNNIATLVNFACHPTFMDAVSTEVSADFLHGFYTETQEKLAGEILFLQGAIGGWVQPENEAKTFENAYKRGSELSDVVINGLDKAKKLKEKKIRYQSRIIQLPVENKTWRMLSEMGTIARKFDEKVETEISYFRIGNTSFITHPGETSPYHSLESKKLMGRGTKFVLGLGNDALGYILKPSFFDNSSLPFAEYLTGMSLGRETGTILMENIKSLMLNKK